MVSEVYHQSIACYVLCLQFEKVVYMSIIACVVIIFPSVCVTLHKDKADAHVRIVRFYYL